MGHMPNLKQVIDVLETLYPLRYAEEWDEPGLIVGDLSHDVHRIVFAADPTSAIIDKAIATGADLLITHHPLFFRSVHETSGLGFRGDIVRRLMPTLRIAAWDRRRPTTSDSSTRNHSCRLTMQTPLIRSAWGVWVVCRSLLP